MDVPATPSPFQAIKSRTDALESKENWAVSNQTIGDGVQPDSKNECAALDDLNGQIEDIFARIHGNFEHNCRVFRMRSSQVMQKIEELEGNLKDILVLLQENEGLALDEADNATMVSMIAQDDLPHKTPSQPPRA
jgi:hypothetical protein